MCQRSGLKIKLPYNNLSFLNPMLTLHIYNLNYKLRIKHLKIELMGLLNTVSRNFHIKMTHKLPGEAWVRFSNSKDLNTVISLFKDFYFLDRKIKIEKAKREMIKKRTIIVKDVGVEEYIVLKDILKGSTGVRYVEAKRVAFIDTEESEKILEILKNNEHLKKCTCEYSK